MRPQNKDPVTYLPAEISAHILSYLDHRTLANCESVARHWRVAATNPHVWRLVFWNEHGPWQSKPGKDWKTMFIANKRLQERWQKADMSYKYMNGHTDSVYCVQFDEYVASFCLQIRWASKLIMEQQEGHYWITG
jgi:F-box and WD-40 domain protein 1/11